MPEEEFLRRNKVFKRSEMSMGYLQYFVVLSTCGQNLKRTQFELSVTAEFIGRSLYRLREDIHFKVMVSGIFMCVIFVLYE